MFNFIHDIEWMRAYTRKNKRKQHQKNVRRNYRRVYKEIKRCAKLGMNDATIRFFIYEENTRRLVNEGYKIEKNCYTSGMVWRIIW